LNYDNHLRSAQRKVRRTKGELGTQPSQRLGRDLNPLAVSHFTDNPNSTARRKDSMDKWCDRPEALQCRESNPDRSSVHLRRFAPLYWKITDQLRPIEIGVTNRIRTGTDAFTGRDAAVTSWPPF